MPSYSSDKENIEYKYSLIDDKSLFSSVKTPTSPMITGIPLFTVKLCNIRKFCNNSL